MKNIPTGRIEANTPCGVPLAMALTAMMLAGSTWTTAAVGGTASSAPCTNEADFQPGTVVDYESRDNVSPVTSRSKTQTLGRKDFAGTRPVASLHTTFMNNSPVFLTTTYAQIKDGQLIRYGDQHGAGASLTTTLYTPPPATPLDLQPGQTVSVSYKSQAGSGGVTVGFEVTEKLTYHAVRRSRRRSGRSRPVGSPMKFPRDRHPVNNRNRGWWCRIGFLSKGHTAGSQSGQSAPRVRRGRNASLKWSRCVMKRAPTRSILS